MISCSGEAPLTIESKGFSLEANSVFVDGISIDSITYASGVKLWRLEGALYVDGRNSTYSLLYDKNPKSKGARLMYSSPPDCFPISADEVECISTFEKCRVTISWRSKGKILLVRSAFTSTH